MKNLTAYQVKSTTENGADFVIKSFKTRDQAEDFELENREKYNFNIYIEKNIFKI